MTRTELPITAKETSDGFFFFFFFKEGEEIPPSSPFRLLPTMEFAPFSRVSMA